MSRPRCQGQFIPSLQEGRVSRESPGRALTQHSPEEEEEELRCHSCLL